MLGDIECGHNATDKVWPYVTVALGREFNVERQYDKCRFYVLALFVAGM